MTGISISIEMRDEAARSHLQGILDRIDNRRPLFASIGDRLIKSASDSFQAEKGPDGKPWVSLQPATIRARHKKKQTPIAILRARGYLAGSIRKIVTNDEVQVGSPVAYAAIHQLGGTIQKPAGSRWMAGRRFARKADAPDGREVSIPAHTITIPARPYLGLSPADEAAILEDAIGWLSP